MFKTSELREEAQRVCDQLDSDLFPETYAELSDAFVGDDSPFFVASSLLECDEPKDLPSFVIEYTER